MNDFKAAIFRFSKVFVPNRCEFCGEVTELHNTVCPDCLSLPVINPPLCRSCGCARKDCKCDNKAEYKQIVAPYYYKDNVVLAVHRYKGSDMRFLSARFARDMAKTVSDNYSDISFDTVTFVPMTKLSSFKRGYNQSEILAEKLAQILKVPMKPLLVKVEHTKPQKKLSARRRKVNLYGAFDVIDKEYVEGKTILLIDDVKTTGSTLNECTKMLKIYGAKAVYCATLAIVEPKSKKDKDKKKKSE